MQITAFDFGVLITHENSNVFHFFNIGDKNSLKRFFHTKNKRNYINSICYLSVSNKEIEMPGYQEMLSFIFSECTKASHTKYSLSQIEEKIENLPKEIYEKKVMLEIR